MVRETMGSLPSGSPLPYAVDNDRLRLAAGPSPRAVRIATELGIARDDEPVILDGFAPDPEEAALGVLDAFSQLRGARRCSLLIVGSGRSKPRSGGAPRRSQTYRDRVYEPGAVARAYCVRDIFTLFSRRPRDMGARVNEAMNFALLIVVSDKVGCAADLVTQGDNGFIVDHRDPAPLPHGCRSSSSRRRSANGWARIGRRCLALDLRTCS